MSKHSQEPQAADIKAQHPETSGLQPALNAHSSNRRRLKTDQPVDKPFIVLDDAIDQAQALVESLKRLGEYKHPFAVRKIRKEVISMQKAEESMQIRAGNRTYFIDVEKTSKDKLYLRVTESRFKGKGGERERNSLVVFPEKIEEFVAAISKLAKEIS